MKKITYLVLTCAVFTFAPYSFSHNGVSLERPHQSDFRSLPEYLDAVIEFNKAKKIELNQKRKQARENIRNGDNIATENLLSLAKASNDVGLILNFPLTRLKREDERSVLVNWAKNKKRCVHVVKSQDKYFILRQGDSSKYGTTASCNPPHLALNNYLEDEDWTLEKIIDRFKEDDPLDDLTFIDDIEIVESIGLETALEVFNLRSVGNDGKQIKATFVFEDQLSRTRLEDFVDDPEARDNFFSGIDSGDLDQLFSNDAENANLQVVFSGVVDVTLVFEDN